MREMVEEDIGTVELTSAEWPPMAPWIAAMSPAMAAAYREEVERRVEWLTINRVDAETFKLMIDARANGEAYPPVIGWAVSIAVPAS